MALVIVASALPMAVRCTSTPNPPGTEPSYSVDLAGERSEGAINGVGLTYDVDGATFDEWLALNADLTSSLKIVTQAEIDAWADTANQYGFELGLSAEGPAPISPVAGGLAVEAEQLRTAAQRHRMAELALRQAEQAATVATAQVDAAKAEREAAEASARAAAEAVAKTQAAVQQPAPAAPAPTPAPHQPHQPRQPHHEPSREA